MPKKSWPRRLALTAVAALVLVVVLSAILLQALHTSRGQRAVLDSVSRRTVAAVGIAIDAEGFRLRPLGGSLEIRGLSLRTPGAAPFASAESLSLKWRGGAILRSPYELQRLEIDRPLFDLGASLPAPPEDDAEAEASPTPELPLSIRQLVIHQGAVAGGPAVGEILNGWSVSAVAVSGAFDGRRLALERMSAAASLEPAWREGAVVGVAVELAGHADLDGAVDLGEIRLTGDGVDGVAAARTGPGFGAPSASFDLAVDPGRWLADAASGAVEVRGELDLGSWQGRVELDSGDQPATLATVFVPPEMLEKLDLEATHLRLESDLRLSGERAVDGEVRLVASRSGSAILELEARPEVSLGDEPRARIPLSVELLPGIAGTFTLPEAVADLELGATRLRLESDLRISHERAVAGELRLVASRSGIVVLDLEARPDLRLGDEPGARIPLNAELLPASAGRRRLSARLDSNDPGTLDTWTVRDGVVTLDEPELRRRLRGLAQLYPRLLPPEALSDLPPLGALAARGAFAGALTAPALSLDARLRPPESGRIDLDLAAPSPAGPFRLRTEGREVEIAAFVASVSGRVDWNGEIEDALGAARGRLEVSSGPLTGEAGPLAESIEAELSGDRGRIDWRLDARRGDGAAIAATGTVDARLPLAAATGQAAVDTGDPRLPRIDGSFELTGGVLAATATAALNGRGPLEIEASLPLATLGRVPALAALAEQPLVRAEGPLEVEWRADPGPWTGVQASIGDSPITRLTAGGSGRLTLDPSCPVCSRLEAEISGIDLELDDGRRAAAANDLRLDLADGRLRLADWRLNGPGLELTARGALDLDRGWRPGDDLVALVADLEASLEGEMGPEWLDLLGPAAPDRVELRATAGGALDRVSGRIDLGASGFPLLHGAGLPFALSDGMLRFEEATVATAGGDGTLRFEIPVDGRPGGLIKAAWDLPLNDWTPLVRSLTGGEDPELLEGALRGTVELDPKRPGAARATAVVDGARIIIRGRETRIEPALELGIEDGKARIEPFELATSSEAFSFEANAELAREWTADRPLADLVSSFSLDGDGRVDAGLLNPWLAGGRASGTLDLDLDLAGRGTDWSGRVGIEGADASLVYPGTYLVRLTRPSLELSIAEGRITVERGSARINEGAASFSGVVWDGTRTDLALRLEDSLFRLDYGLLATLGADLRLRAAGLDDMSLTGEIEVARGSLTRELRPDLDFLSEFLTPVDLTTTEQSVLDSLSLDLRVRTREGVRIDNNLAEMLVRWEPLTVTGSAARPVIAGRLEADPGGLLFLYGQTVRLDSAAIEYPGIANAEARLDFEVTTSLEDPTIERLAGDDLFRSTRRGEEAPPADATGDLARYLSESLAGRVGEAVGVNVSLRPLLIFGETDPGARLTVSRDLSPNLTLAASIDLRQAEAQTYLLELHELDALPQLVTQVFTDDESSFGTVLLQRRQFGSQRPAERRTLPRVTRIEIDPPPGVSRRAARRATGLAGGEVFEPDRRFAAEVELIDFLRRRGYTDAEVSIRPVADARRTRRTRLEVDIDPGPRAFFAFEGEKLAKPLRRLIAGLYRSDFFEPEALVEMRDETVRALRSRGFLDPRVEIDVEPLDPGRPEADRRVTVHTVGGVRVSRDAPIFKGLPSEDVAVLDALFFNTVQRVELAVGLESADRRLLGALADLGYPDARIANRYQSLDDRVLTVEIEPGRRLTAGEVAIELAEGASGPAMSELQPLITLAEGDPLARVELGRSALALERELAARGHLAARVRTIVETIGDGDGDGDGDGGEPTRAVRFNVDPGPVSRLAEVTFDGLGSTQEGWARRVIGLEPGAILAGRDLAAARTALWRTGLFSAVSTRTLDADPGATTAVFDLTERDRYRLAYGARWDSETGIGAVVELTDDNFRGRGWTLGLRAQYSSDEETLRGLARIPRAFGGAGSLELFAAMSEITDSTFDIVFGRSAVIDEIFETTLQYSHPLGRSGTVRLYGRYTDTESRTLFVTEEITDPALGVQFLYDNRSPEPVLRRGLFASVDLSGSEEFLGGDLRYARLFSQLNLHRPLTTRGALTWSQSLRLGLAKAFENQELIRDVRFFAGGEFSVRGYETESLGEVGGLFTGRQALGGGALLVINQELRWGFAEDYALVGFVDAGEVWPEIGDLGLDLRLSAGLGLRAVTPIGLVRIDLAHALDRRPEIDPEFKLYVGLGSVF